MPTSDATEYLQSVREKYIGQFQATVQHLQAEGKTCETEVWMQPDIKPNQPAPPHPLCIDILVRDSDKPGMFAVSDEVTEGPLIRTTQVASALLKLYPAFWSSLPVWIRHPNPDWTALETWRTKWMKTDASRSSENDGFSGVVHYVGNRMLEGGGYLYVIDFGSAPVEAAVELIDTLASMGATDIELGRSDGSDLPKDVLQELRRPELSLQNLNDAIIALLRTLPEVHAAAAVAPDRIEVASTRGTKHFLILENLHRALQRTGVEARPREVYRFVRGQRESQLHEDVPDLSQLRPVIKDNGFIANVEKLGPKMKPMVRKPLAADLWVLCVWDSVNGMRFATREEIENFGLSDQQALDRARENYLKSERSIEVTQDGALLVAQTRDCYDATLILDDNWLQTIEEKVKGRLIACVPARNLVLLGSSENPACIRQMRQAAKRIEAGGDHLISGTIFVRESGQWKQFQPEPASPAPSSSPPPTSKRWWRFWNTDDRK